MKEEVFNICQDFLDLIEVGKRDTAKGNENYLKMYLNMLPVFVEKVNYCSENIDTPEIPVSEYQTRRKKAEERFPNYGMYNSVSRISENIGNCEITVGDAIDDIADIYGDLSSVMWLTNNGYHDAAIHEFNMSYNIHWGMHCHELQLYIHALQNER